jgi:hypothetical protein
MAKQKITNYIEHGSHQHMELLGLRKANPDDVPEFDGYALVDTTAFGPAARPEYLKEVLRQKVTEFKTKPVMPQSEDPRGKNYAPPIFNPNPGQKSDIAGVTTYQP